MQNQLSANRSWFSLVDVYHESFIDYGLFTIEYFARCIEGGRIPKRARARLEQGIALPLNFLLELYAMGQIGLWERSGFAPTVLRDLPSFSSAVAGLRNRVSHSPKCFFKAEPFDRSDLFDKILVTYFLNFCHSDELGCEILVSEVDETVLVNAIADLLFWAHRNDVASGRDAIFPRHAARSLFATFCQEFLRKQSRIAIQ